MIQRIQSLFLVCGALCLGALLVFQSAWTTPGQALEWFTPAALGLAILLIVVAVATIFLYRDRNRQVKVVLYLQLLTLALIAVFGLGYYLSGSLELLFKGGLSALGTAMFLMPFLAYVFFSLARRGIDRDIRLIQSMDRLR